MSNSGAIRAGRAEVEVGTDNSPLHRGLQSAQGMLKNWGNGLQAIGGGIFKPLALAGAAGLGGLTMIAQQLGDFGGEIDDMSQRTGLTTEAVSELGHAATMSGTDLGTLEGGLTKMQKLLSEAALGSKSATGELQQLGLKASDLVNLAPDQQMAKFADAIAGLSSPADRANAAMSIFGKSGQKLLPMLQGGAAGLQEMRDEAKALGLSMSGEDAKAAAELGDSLDKLKAAGKAAAFNLGMALVPALQTVFTTVSTAAGGIATWVKNNRGVIVIGVAAAAAVLGLAGVIWAAGLAFTALSIAIGIAQALLVGFTAVLGFLVSVPGLIVVGLALLATWFITSTEIGMQALGWLGEAWGVLQGEVLTAWGAIVTAIGAGDLKAAFSVAMAYLKVQWVRITGFLEQAWASFVGTFSSLWSTAQAAVAKLWIDTGAALETAWIRTTSFLADAWTAFTNIFMQTWRTAQNLVGKGVAWLVAKVQGKDHKEVWAEMDADLAQRNNAGQGSADAAILAREDAKKKSLADIESRRTSDNAKVDAETNRQNAERATRQAAGEAAADAELKAAQDALAAAAAAARKPPTAATPDAPTPGLGPKTLQKLNNGADKAKSLASEAVDSRSQEGMKAILTAFTGRNDPQEEIAANTKATADAAVLTAEETAKTRRILEEGNKAEETEDADLS